MTARGQAAGLLGLYVPRPSPLHALTPGPKLLALLLAGAGVFALRSPGPLLLVLAAVVGLYGVARLGGRVLWGQLRPTLALLAFFFAVQALTVNVDSGVVTVLRFAVMILLASLLTLTTRTSDLLATLERALQPLRRVGVNPEKVSLAVSLTLRFIPVVIGIVAEVRDAQRARGLDGSVLALAVPVIIRTLRMADDIADAIDARS
ncbi:energy-coupling factor transporter transmembrane component T family protein [Deinococcus ficus]|uniref:energy-coupling factor transporter transmembrane component T family protein n=1 Tax=Deinococcus ficus TaxID=317577 RepID=UPI0003B57A82|nr:energy-coupling factor transporter transmembrane protein EcfT [Deinococcus ficus]GHF74947.1 cobalt ABC transporter permease [Deinococcus ficus]